MRTFKGVLQFRPNTRSDSEGGLIAFLPVGPENAIAVFPHCDDALSFTDPGYYPVVIELNGTLESNRAAHAHLARPEEIKEMITQILPLV